MNFYFIPSCLIPFVLLLTEANVGLDVGEVLCASEAHNDVRVQLHYYAYSLISFEDLETFLRWLVLVKPTIWRKIAKEAATP